MPAKEHKEPPSRDEPEWVSWPDERLLDMRLCDLGLSIRRSKLWGRIRQLRAELEAHGLVFRPHFWLSDEWFCPDGVPGIAMPFFLAHPRLERLERRLMHEVEGASREQCLRLMRHETGHAIDNAYRLRRRRRRQRLFGASSQRYLDDYMPRPYSRKYVVYLDGWYAQSHPDEDFAETFAVWLDPKVNWRRRYGGWPARKKLEYLDELMAELAGKPPIVENRQRIDPLGRLTKTVREYYDEKQERYSIDVEASYDRDLRRLFSDAAEARKAPSAARFIGRVRKDVRQHVARWTGVYQYTIDQVIGEMIDRCRELGLRLASPEEQAKLDLTIALTVQTMKYVHSGRHRYVR